MGSEVEEQPSSTTKTTLKDYIYNLCSYALAIGMSYHDFWYGDIDMFQFYYKADQIKLARRNQDLWLQGLYVYQAIGSLVPVLNMGSKEKKAKPYLKQPLPITEEERIEQENQKVQNFKNYMMKRAKGGKKDG